MKMFKRNICTLCSCLSVQIMMNGLAVWLIVNGGGGSGLPVGIKGKQ